ncbi:hypothetical protein NMT25_002353 [Vibrio cholerae]|nr:hypothetical protein [Vibrio cholerae]EJL6938153.1 hypothetical protein [Vibrio cholerae]EKF9409986.1 hypothetical protein [Vibrio cholerae]
MTIEQDLQETISFLQDFIDQADLGLSVEPLSHDDFEALVRDERTVLNWICMHGHYLHDDSFHLGFRLVSESKLDGAMLGVYASSDEKLHIFLMESLVRDDRFHPLNGRLTTLVVIAATYFLALREGIGAYVVQPHEHLVQHYELFGFEATTVGNLAMYASYEALQEAQQRIMSELLN